MKQASILVITLFILSFSCFVQLEAKTWMFGGGGNFYASGSDYTSYVQAENNGHSKELHLSLSPNVGYFLVDKLAVGVKPYFSWGKGETTSANGSIFTGNSKRYGIGPFVRYYFLNQEKQYNILTDISYQIGVWDEGGKGDLRNFSFLAGPVVYFNSSVGMEFLLGYSMQSEELSRFSKNSSKCFSVNIGFQVHLMK